MLQFTRTKIILILLTCLAGFIVAMPNFLLEGDGRIVALVHAEEAIAFGPRPSGRRPSVARHGPDEIKKDWMNNLRDESRSFSGTPRSASPVSGFKARNL